MNSLTLHVLGLLLPMVALAFLQWHRTRVAALVTYAAAVEGAKLLREWCSWLATLSTAAIGVASFNPSGFLSITVGKDLAVLAVFSFAASLVCTATLLLALPSLVLRLKQEPSGENDLYELTAFAWTPKHLANLFRVGFLASVQYHFFVAGVGLVAYLFALLPPKS